MSIIYSREVAILTTYRFTRLDLSICVKFITSFLTSFNVIEVNV